MDCSVWRSWNRLWTAAWAGHPPATQMPCALICISRVCPLPTPSTHFIPQSWSADHAPLYSAEKRAGVFHLQATSGPYGLNFSEAEAACKAQGAILASFPQLSAAQQVCGAQKLGPSVGGGLDWVLGLSIPSCSYSWASTCASWAGWPTALLPTLWFSLWRTVAMVGWA